MRQNFNTPVRSLKPPFTNGAHTNRRLILDSNDTPRTSAPQPLSSLHVSYLRVFAQITVRDAINSALDEELARDERVCMLGEEVGVVCRGFVSTHTVGSPMRGMEDPS